MTFSVATLFSGSARADLFVYDFGAPSIDKNTVKDLGTSAIFSAKTPADQAYTLGAKAIYVGSGTDDGAHLYAKNGGAGETGLGTSPDLGDDHEIDVNHAVQLNFSTIKSLSTISSISFKIGSTSGKEGYVIYGIDSLGVRTQIARDNNNGVGSNSNNLTELTYNASSSDITTYNSFAISAVNGDGSHPEANVLLETVTVNTKGGTNAVPEPASVALMLGGMSVVGIYNRNRARRVRQTTEA